MKRAILFLSYSHKDMVWKDRLLSHLRVLERQGQLEIWDTSDIQTGTDWSKQIHDAVKKADVAVLLISPDFLASDFIINRELPALLQRRERDGMAVLPIVVRPAPWSQISGLAPLQFLNTDAKPLSAGSEYEVDQALASIAKRIGEISGAIIERESIRSTKQKVSKAPPPPKVADGRYFISHSKVDGDFAELLQLRLEKEGLEAWVDTDRLDPGVDWRQEIDDAIRQSRAVIAVMSPDARESEYVTYEWAYAWGCGTRIIPLMLRQTPLHPRLATLQYLDFSNRVSRPWSKLLDALHTETKVSSSDENATDTSNGRTGDR